MAWNEDGNGKDPWKRDGNQPNDLDQIVQDWQKKFGRILGGGSGGGVGGVGGIVIAVLLVAAWLLTGFYRVDAAERGVEQRFGKYIEPVTLPGLRWHWPFPVESVDIVNIEQVNDFNYSTEMLTADLWYVYIDIAVQYRRTDPVAYSFLVENPEMTLQDFVSYLAPIFWYSPDEPSLGGRHGPELALPEPFLQSPTGQDLGGGIVGRTIHGEAPRPASCLRCGRFPWAAASR